VGADVALTQAAEKEMTRRFSCCTPADKNLEQLGGSTSRRHMVLKWVNLISAATLNGFTRRLLTIPPGLRKTMTYDQGSEMALHQILAKRLRIDIFFCDPHSPWQRGSNENANGLIREYLPKGIDLSQFSHQQLSVFEQSLNHRPRKIVGFRTPHEVFNALKLDDIAGVALQA
jgi:IS30 family transposase